MIQIQSIWKFSTTARSHRPIEDKAKLENTIQHESEKQIYKFAKLDVYEISICKKKQLSSKDWSAREQSVQKNVREEYLIQVQS